MKKIVWIFNHHANSMFFDNGGRHYSFAKYLKKKGYEPVIFCSNAKHGTGELYFDDLDIWKKYINENIDVPFVFVKGRPYVGNGKNRILCMVDYYKNVKKAAKEYSDKYGKPDVIIGSQVHPLAVVSAIKLAKKYGVKSIAEIRDLWPESIVAYGVAKKNNPIILLLRCLEKWIYAHCDKIIFTMENAYDYIKKKKWEKIVPAEKVSFINNGVDLELFDYNKDHYCIDDCDLKDSSYLKIVYAGSIRKANQIGFLIDVAKQITNPNIRFLIWGSGDEEQYLKERVKSEGINNVVIKGKVEKKFVPYIVSNADYNFLDGMDSYLLKYGLSANKLFDYFAARKPAITLVDGICNPIVKMSAGVVISNNVINAAEEIEKLPLIDSDEYDVICRKTGAAAEEYDFKKLTQKLIDIIEKLQ